MSSSQTIQPTYLPMPTYVNVQPGASAPATSTEPGISSDGYHTLIDNVADNERTQPSASRPGSSANDTSLVDNDIYQNQYESVE